jgi:hypothetical protein
VLKTKETLPFISLFMLAGVSTEQMHEAPQQRLQSARGIAAAENHEQSQVTSELWQVISRPDQGLVLGNDHPRL